MLSCIFCCRLLISRLSLSYICSNRGSFVTVRFMDASVASRIWLNILYSSLVNICLSLCWTFSCSSTLTMENDMSSIMSRVFEKFSRMTGERIHDEKGWEIPDPTPVEPAVGHRPGPTLREQIRAMVAEASREAEAAGYETLEEADDFDIGDDFEPESPYELDRDLPAIAELKRRKEEAEKSPQAPSPKPKKKPVAPDQGASGIDSPSESIEDPQGPYAGE